MGVREDVTWQLEPIPLGRARIHREGRDVTVVAVGHLVHDALAVADEAAAQDGVELEVLDPRTLFPFDRKALEVSLAKTGRLVVVDDSNRSCGFGAEILALAAESGLLRAAPRRVGRPDGAVLPFAIELDRALQPSRESLRRAISDLLV
jgi:pyruvate dehydrogenase E1 component beta subunit